MDNARYSIERLGKKHNKARFESGSTPLDRYLVHQAGQDMRRKITAVYVLTAPSSDDVIGYYTLSSTSLELNKLPEGQLKKLPRYPLLPATLIGRLAVDEHHQGKGMGQLLLVHALKSSLEYSNKVASSAVIVEAKDKYASRFYQHFGFIPFSDTPDKLYLPMNTINKVGF